MTVPTSDSPGAARWPFSMGSGPFLIRALIALMAVGIPGSLFLRAALKRKSDYQHFESEVKARHPGLLAWMEGREAKVLDVADLPGDAKARTFTFDGDLQKLMFSPDGARLYAVIDKGADEQADLLVALDLATGLQTTTLDPAGAKLGGEAFDLSEMWVIPWGEAESETDRIVFRMEDSEDWYSVEGKRPRVRPEPGRPAKPWEQAKCPDGEHEFRKTSSKSESHLVIGDGRFAITVTTRRVQGLGVWWCSRK